MQEGAHRSACLGGAGTGQFEGRGQRSDRCVPLGEHMNFRNQEHPPDQVKGIIEQFGGSWNGYTWIDQTTYMETASTVSPRSHVHRGQRMASCLYDRRTASRSAP